MDSNFPTTALSTQHAHMEVHSVVERVKVNMWSIVVQQSQHGAHGAMNISKGTHQATKNEFGSMVPQLNRGSEESTQAFYRSSGIGNREPYFVHF